MINLTLVIIYQFKPQMDDQFNCKQSDTILILNTKLNHQQIPKSIPFTFQKIRNKYTINYVESQKYTYYNLMILGEINGLFKSSQQSMKKNLQQFSRYNTIHDKIFYMHLSIYNFDFHIYVKYVLSFTQMIQNNVQIFMISTFFLTK
ncbi:hypothetical protein pb186bvf_019066 [Paramecium bursaria]